MIAAFATLFVVALSYGVEIPQLPQLVGEENATAGLLSLLFVSYSVSKISLQMPAGVWIDRTSPRRALLLALLLNAVGVSIFIATTMPALLVVARILSGAASALTFPATFAVVAATNDVAIGKRLGMVGSVAAFGMLAGFGLAAAMAAPLGPRAPLVVVLVLCIVLAVVQMLAGDAPKKEREHLLLRDEWSSLLSHIRTIAFIGLILPVAFNKLTFTGFQATLPVLGPADFDLGTTGVASLFGATGILFGISQVASGALADRLHGVVGPAVAGALLVGTLLLCAIADSLEGFVTGFCLYILCSSFVFAWTLRTLALDSDEDSYGKNFAAFATLTDLMTVAGPPLSLWLYDVHGRHAFAMVALVALPFYYVFVRYAKGAGGTP